MAKNAGLTEHKLEAFAEDLGRLLGEAQNKAESWLGQRAEIIQHLEGVRDTANGLLRQLGSATAAAARRSRPAAAAALKTVRARTQLSPEARERIAAAQRRRWAKFRRERKKA
jgi:ElaB/YqjD/DUF883 family membrane-anchored ribosome-binding protein